MPITIPEAFASLFAISERGENPKWRMNLISAGLVDINKTTHANIVCIKPKTNLDYKDLKQKAEWLSPYNNSDPVVTTVIKKINTNLEEWNSSNS